MSKGILPKEITVKFLDDGTRIEVVADGTQFPFEITEFYVNYNPDTGAEFGISAGSNLRKQEPKPVENIKAVVPKQSIPSMPSAMGIISSDESSSQELTTAQLHHLNKLYPNRRNKIVSKLDVSGLNEVAFLHIETTQLPIYNDTDMDDLLAQLLEEFAQREEEAFEGDYDTNTRFVTIQPPQLVYEDDSVFIEERFKVYEKN